MLLLCGLFARTRVVFLLRVTRYMCVVRLSDEYMLGDKDCCVTILIIREVIIMRSTPVM